MERVIAFATELFDLFKPGCHLARHFGRVIDDDLVVLLRRVAQGRAHELVELLQVGFSFFGAGQNDRKRHIAVVGMHQNPEQIQELFCRACAAREDDDAVAYAYKSFKALFDVRQDHQFIDDRVGRFGRNDPGFGQPQIASARQALLGVGNRGPFHWAFHDAGTTASADVQ